MKSIDNSQVTENTEEVLRFCANLSSLSCSFPYFTCLAIEIFRGDFLINFHVVWLTGFPAFFTIARGYATVSSVEWLQLWCNSIFNHPSSQIQISVKIPILATEL